MALAEPLPLPAPEPDAPLEPAAPEPGPFAGWIGVIVPADEPGEGYPGGVHYRSSKTRTPGKILLLVPPNLLAALRNGQAT